MDASNNIVVKNAAGVIMSPSGSAADKAALSGARAVTALLAAGLLLLSVRVPLSAWAQPGSDDHSPIDVRAGDSPITMRAGATSLSQACNSRLSGICLK